MENPGLRGQLVKKDLERERERAREKELERRREAVAGCWVGWVQH